MTITLTHNPVKIMQHTNSPREESLHEINLNRNLFAHRNLVLMYFETNDLNLFENFFGSAIVMQAMEKALTSLNKICASLINGYFEIKEINHTGHIIIFEKEKLETPDIVNLLVKIRPIIREEINKVFFPLTGQKADLKVGYSFLPGGNGNCTFQEKIYRATMEARQSAVCKLDLKDLPLLVEVSKISKDIHLIIIGDGPYRFEMEYKLKDLPVTFTGYLSGEDLTQAYASSDLFVFPSTTDTFGNVVLEAQASGIPAIVVNEGGPMENILDNKTGLIIQADDSQALKDAVHALVNNPARLKEMGHQARVYMEGRSFEKAFDQTWEMYARSA
ncbi:MAG: glycosyltransferase [Desulfonatronovibrio sp. MSAO_Bac4]|nr:MAG: glycosyltransferase [Desulfonatronovibrio sp. MSAO_Bac4]